MKKLIALFVGMLLFAPLLASHASAVPYTPSVVVIAPNTPAYYVLAKEIARAQDGVVILVTPGKFDENVLLQIEAMAPNHVIILGDEKMVPREYELKLKGIGTERIAGATFDDTVLAVYKELAPFGDAKNVIVVNSKYPELLLAAYVEYGNYIVLPGNDSMKGDFGSGVKTVYLDWGTPVYVDVDKALDMLMKGLPEDVQKQIKYYASVGLYTSAFMLALNTPKEVNMEFPVYFYKDSRVSFSYEKIVYNSVGVVDHTTIVGTVDYMNNSFVFTSNNVTVSFNGYHMVTISNGTNTMNFYGFYAPPRPIIYTVSDGQAVANIYSFNIPFTGEYYTHYNTTTIAYWNVQNGMTTIIREIIVAPYPNYTLG